jgi:hypothetical protein
MKFTTRTRSYEDQCEMGLGGRRDRSIDGIESTRIDDRDAVDAPPNAVLSLARAASGTT